MLRSASAQHHRLGVLGAQPNARVRLSSGEPVPLYYARNERSLWQRFVCFAPSFLRQTAAVAIPILERSAGNNFPIDIPYLLGYYSRDEEAKGVISLSSHNLSPATVANPSRFDLHNTVRTPLNILFSMGCRLLCRSLPCSDTRKPLFSTAYSLFLQNRGVGVSTRHGSVGPTTGRRGICAATRHPLRQASSCLCGLCALCGGVFLFASIFASLGWSYAQPTLARHRPPTPLKF
jgi:hypothetical protein